MNAESALRYDVGNKGSDGVIRKIQLAPAVAAIISTAIALAIFGPGIANPLNLSWIQGDAITNQFGWHQYQTDPAHFYPLVTDRTSYPLPMPNTIFGTIPIIDIFLKLLAPILPAPMQYLGPAFVAGVALQALLGWALLREATPHGTGAFYKMSLLLGALFFGTAPVMLIRFYYTHVTLALHWPILLSLLVYLRSFRKSYWLTIRDFSLTTFISVGINPYTMVMSLLIYGGFIVKSIYERSLRWPEYLFLVLPMVFGILGLYVFSYIELNSLGVFVTDGFGLFSANFLSPVDPTYAYFSSEFIGDPHVAGPGQYEGFGYVGVGVMFLLAVSAIVGLAHWRSPSGNAGRINWPLVAVVLVSYVWAMSNIMAFGTHIVSFPLPSGVLAILQNFRSSGRFIADVDYVLMFIGITALVRRLKPQHAAMVLSFAALLQVADLARPFAQVHNRFTSRFLAKGIVERFADPAYQGLGRAHDTLLVLPPWQCRDWKNAKPDYPAPMFMKFSNLAMDENIRTNSFYGGRTPVIQGFYHCAVFPKQFLAKPTDRRTAYILSPRTFGLYGAHIATTHSCDFADDMFICRGDGIAPGLTERAQRQLASEGTGNLAR